MPDQNTKRHVVRCAYCKKKYFRSLQRINEAQKYGWRSFCSIACQSLGRSKGEKRTCSRIGCNNIFYRALGDIKKTNLSYCSLSCAATSNNKNRIPKPKRKCKLCNNYLKYGKKYCSLRCQGLGAITTKEEVIESIRSFYKINGRIPLKIEVGNYKSARFRFGTWNKAIIAAGFEPNPVLFAKKYIANDGHKCDSLSEKIIDDWMFRRSIKHKRSVPYPDHEQFTADFVVDKYWIEFFGLSGESKKYDFLKRKKIRIAKNLGLNLIKTYPKDLYPKGNLNKVLSFLTNEN